MLDGLQVMYGAPVIRVKCLIVGLDWRRMPLEKLSEPRSPLVVLSFIRFAYTYLT
jgi:hypothetical protein